MARNTTTNTTRNTNGHEREPPGTRTATNGNHQEQRTMSKWLAFMIVTCKSSRTQPWANYHWWHLHGCRAANNQERPGTPPRTTTTNGHEPPGTARNNEPWVNDLHLWQSLAKAHEHNHEQTIIDDIWMDKRLQICEQPGTRTATNTTTNNHEHTRL